MIGKRVAGLFSIVLLFPFSAFAYLDPGSSNTFFQSALVLIGTGFIFLKFYWRRLFGLFKKKDIQVEGKPPEQRDH